MAAEGLWMSIEERERLPWSARRKRSGCRSVRRRSGWGSGCGSSNAWCDHGSNWGTPAWCRGQRGRPSNNRLARGERERIALLLRDKYPDFGPTLAVEKLLEREAIVVSVETVRQMQIDMGLWRPKKRQRKRVF